MERVLQYVIYLVLALVVVGMMGAYSARLYGDKYFNAKKIASELSLVMDSVSNFPFDLTATLSFPQGYDITIAPPCEISVYVKNKLFSQEKCLLYKFDKEYHVSTPFLTIKKENGEISIK